MKKQEFLTKYLVQREGSNSLKWDALDARFNDPNLISMWVADMEFKVPETVSNVLVDRVNHGVYGYSYVPDSYYESVINWNKKHYDANLVKEDFRLSFGVVTSIYWLISCFTKTDESVLIQTPVYYPFHNAVKDTGRKLITNDLINTNGVYTIDFEDFENKIRDNEVKMFVLCSPHNPVGRVWTNDELEQMFAICEKYNVLIVADEIHQDIIIGDKKFIPASIVANEKYKRIVITLNAASKTFNLACLLNSHIFIYDEELRAVYDAFAKVTNQIEVNIMGTIATEIAYNTGEEWLAALLEVIGDNFQTVKTRLAAEAPEIIVTELEGTYLTWLDLRNIIPSEKSKQFAQDECNLAVDYGEWFGDSGHGFIRLNLATDPQIVDKALDNIIQNIKVWRKNHENN